MPRTTSPRRLAQLTVASLTVIGLLAVQAGAAVPAKTVPPKQWAKTVCPALADFVVHFQSIDKQLSTGVSARPRHRTIILSGIEATIGSADDVAATIKRAGTPKTPKGKKAENAMVEGFHDIQDTLDEAQSVIADLPTGDLEEFANASQEIRDQTDPGARGDLHRASRSSTRRSTVR